MLGGKCQDGSAVLTQQFTTGHGGDSGARIRGKICLGSRIANRRFACGTRRVRCAAARRNTGGPGARSTILSATRARTRASSIRGLRITVYDVLEYLAGGMTEQEILRDFPDLTAEDIRACLAFAADRERRLVTYPAA